MWATLYLNIKSLISIVSLAYRSSAIKYTHLVLRKVSFIASFQGIEMISTLQLFSSFSKYLMFSESEDKDDDDEDDQYEHSQDNDNDYSNEADG